MSSSPCEIDVDFGNLPLGQASSATVRIENVATVSSPECAAAGSILELSQVNPTLDPEFTVDDGPRPPVPAGQFDQIEVGFQPYKAGQVQSTFTTQTDGANPMCPTLGSGGYGSFLTITLTGSGAN